MTRAQLQMKEAALRPWRKPADQVVLVLPFPPSLNNLFFNVPGQRGGRAITDVYKKWRFLAGLELMRQRLGCVFGKVDVTLTFEEPQHARRLDLDGLAKAVLDLCVEHQVIEGDDRRYVRKITLAWCASAQGCRVEIRRFGAEP
jgi:Holliday junction resolvase RusA-like endonuclease